MQRKIFSPVFLAWMKIRCATEDSMVWVLAFLAAVGIIAGVTLGPRVAKKLSEGSKDANWHQLEAYVAANGTTEQLDKLAELKRREIDLKLKLIEMEQARDVLSSPKIRSQLESADVDVEHLKQLLAPEAFEEELDRRIRLLSAETTEDKLLTTPGEKKK